MPRYGGGASAGRAGGVRVDALTRPMNDREPEEAAEERDSPESEDPRRERWSN
jgi:hypothetical protein